MDIHIGDFWQNKCNPKVIQHVVNFSFRMGGFPIKKIPDSSHILQWIILKR